MITGILKLSEVTITLAQMVTEVFNVVKRAQTNLHLQHIDVKNQLNEIEICNLGEGVALDVLVQILDISENECYWFGRQNRQILTIPYLQAKESQILRLAYWRFENANVRFLVKWKDCRKKEHTRELILCVSCICNG